MSYQMKKRNIFLILTVLACFSFTQKAKKWHVFFHDLEMYQVQRNDSVVASVKGFDYADSIISIIWEPTANQLNFVIKNNTRTSMQINWDASSIALPDHSGGKVAHNGVKFQDAEKSSVPTTMISGSSLTDGVAPADHVHITWNNDIPQWKLDNLSRPYVSHYTQAEAEEWAVSHQYDSTSVLLAIVVKNVNYEYLFKFKPSGNHIQHGRKVVKGVRPSNLSVQPPTDGSKAWTGCVTGVGLIGLFFLMAE